MYIPKHFAETDVARVRALVESHSFGMLVVPRSETSPEIAHIPFLYDAEPAPHGTLRAHVARPNPIATLLASPLPVVAVFTGPHAYVTPRWYEAPTASVPTWNFTAVHAHGVAVRVDARAEVLRMLADLTAKHEAGAERPWSFAGADPAYVDRLLGGIVAFTVHVERLEAKFKLSQNRTASDRERVARGLRERGSPDDVALAETMQDSGEGG